MAADEAILQRFFNSPHFAKASSLLTWAFELLYALVVIAAFTVLILNITKLARSKDRGLKDERGKALGGILISGCCIAVLGGFGTVVALLLGVI